MVSWILWYLIILIIGFAAWPLMAWLTPALKDRGYSLSKAAGLLLSGFVFWSLVNFRLLQNDFGGVLFSLLVVVCISVWVARVYPAFSWKSLLTDQKRYVLVVECVFLIAFGLIALWRAANPAIVGTEKPMELAFINAILQSHGFPPQDPWLSGYSISYYHFGYILVSMLIRLSGVVSGVGFNLAASLIFAMTAVGTYGLVYNILSSDPVRSFLHHQSDHKEQNNYLWPVLAPIFTLVVSNLEGLLEFLHGRGLFWQRAADGSLTSPFWKWLDIQELVNPPLEPFSWTPNRPGGILWWRASRVVSDYTLSNRWVEVIDEFPFFSFLLSDLHPHVLTLPFAVLALGLGLNLILGGAEGSDKGKGGWLFLSYRYWIFIPILVGGLAFLNTWDFPIYLGILLLCYLVNRIHTSGWSTERLSELITTGLILGGSSVLLYLIFFLGFKSQAGGIIPSLIFYTRGIHFWIMFGTLLLPILFFLIAMYRKSSNWKRFRFGFLYSGIFVLSLWILSYIMGIIALNLAVWGNSLANSMNSAISSIGMKLSEVGFLFAEIQGLQGEPTFLVLVEALSRRMQAPGTWITLWICLSFVMSLLIQKDKQIEMDLPDRNQEKHTSQIPTAAIPPALIFILVIIGAGAIIILIPEFFYLRDQFGTRMNTIFKFYYQGWLLWSISASVGVAILFKLRVDALTTVMRIASVLMLGAGLLYPIIGVESTTRGIRIDDLTLDGNEHLKIYQPDDYLAMEWLSQATPGVIAESVGGSYSQHARMSIQTGYPTIIGWTPHEGQWGRGPVEFGTRIEDVSILYQTKSWEETQIILDRYNVRYVIVGGLERSTYALDESKFAQNLPAVYQNSSVTIYEYNGSTHAPIQ